MVKNQEYLLRAEELGMDTSPLKRERVAWVSGGRAHLSESCRFLGQERAAFEVSPLDPEAGLCPACFEEGLADHGDGRLVSEAKHLVKAERAVERARRGRGGDLADVQVDLEHLRSATRMLTHARFPETRTLREALAEAAAEEEGLARGRVETEGREYVSVACSVDLVGTVKEGKVVAPPLTSAVLELAGERGGAGRLNGKLFGEWRRQRRAGERVEDLLVEVARRQGGKNLGEEERRRLVRDTAQGWDDAAAAVRAGEEVLVALRRERWLQGFPRLLVSAYTGEHDDVWPAEDSVISLPGHVSRWLGAYLPRFWIVELGRREEGDTEEVLHAATVLWRGGGDGPLGDPHLALDAARRL